jgi:hypothetical protein
VRYFAKSYISQRKVLVVLNFFRPWHQYFENPVHTVVILKSVWVSSMINDLIYYAMCWYNFLHVSTSSTPPHPFSCNWVRRHGSTGVLTWPAMYDCSDDGLLYTFSNKPAAAGIAKSRSWAALARAGSTGKWYGPSITVQITPASHSLLAKMDWKLCWDDTLWP